MAKETLAQGEGESPAEEAESEEPQETETEAEQSETALFQDYFDITSEGIDYLSVEGIQLPPGIRLSMVGKDSGSSFWKQVHEGAQQAVDDINKALGFTGDEKVQLNYDAPGDGDIAEQIDIIDQMLDKSPDALIIGFLNSTPAIFIRMSAITTQPPLPGRQAHLCIHGHIHLLRLPW